MSKSHRCRRGLPPLLFAVAMAMVVAACKPTVPSQYVQPDEMEDILYDYYVAQALAGLTPQRDSMAFNKNVYYYATLAKHGLSEAEFDSSLVYYYTDTRRLYDIYRNLSERIGNVAMGLGASVGEIGRYSQMTADGDTANIWRDATAAILMPQPPFNKVTFSIEADSTFRRGDSFQLMFMTDFVFQSGTKEAIACAVVHYADSSKRSSISRVSWSGVSKLRIPANDEADITSIEGFIHLGRGNDDSQTLKLMFINQLQLVKFRKQDQPDAATVMRAESRLEASADSLDDAAAKARRTDDMADRAADMADNAARNGGNGAVMRPDSQPRRPILRGKELQTVPYEPVNNAKRRTR